MNLHWTDTQKLTVDFTERYPMFLIHPDGQKSGKEQTLPMAPEFAEWMGQTPEDQRTDFVFNPHQLTQSNRRVRVDFTSQKISKIGKKPG